MDRLFIDFRRERSVEDATLALALLVLGGIIFAVAAASYLRTTDRLAGVTQQSEEVRQLALRRSGSLTDRKGDTPETRQTVAQANAVLQALNLPWSRLFDVMGQAKQPTVALLAVTPDVLQRNLKISGEGKNIDAVLRYIERLEATDLLENVHLQGHEVVTQDPQKPVRFVIAATWRNVQ